MKMMLALVMVGTLAAGGSARAADVAVFPPTAVNITTGQAEAVATLLSQAYAQASASTVLSPSEAAAALADNADHVVAAQKLGLTEFIDVSVVGLLGEGDDNRIIVQVVRRETAGDVIFRAQMTAGSVGDLELVCERLARALVEKVAPEKTQTVQTVTRREATPENRVWSQSVRGLKTQLTQPLASGHEFETMLAVGFDGRFEGQRGFLEVGAGMFVPRSGDDQSVGYGGLYAEFGGSYYLSRSSASPYIGVGLIPRLVIGDIANGGVGLAAYGQVGVMLFREWRSRMYVDLRVSQNLMSMRDHRDSAYNSYYGTQPQSGDEFYPTEIGLELGIGW